MEVESPLTEMPITDGLRRRLVDLRSAWHDQFGATFAGAWLERAIAACDRDLESCQAIMCNTQRQAGVE